MSLESLLKPAKWADKNVQKQFTRLGKKIPEEHLYKVTLGAQLVGNMGIAVWGVDIGIPGVVGGCVSSLFGAPDFLYNLNGLHGRIQKNFYGEVISNDLIQDSGSKYNRAIRLPVFLTGVGFLGKVACDVANYFMNGEPLTSDTAMNATASFSFLSLASSMYLKDQDPKSLERKPSRVKEFFRSLYEKAKGLAPSPIPTPQPVPVQACSTLDSYLF